MSKQVFLKDRINLEGNFNKQDPVRNGYRLTDALAREGYDWWWHSFTGRHAETGKEKAFFIEFFTVNPALGGDEPVLGQLAENKAKGIRPSYLMVKAGAWGRDARQLHRFFGWNRVAVSKEVPYRIEAEDCLCSETETRGSIAIQPEEAGMHPEWMCDHGSMTWNLTMEKQVAFNVGYGAGKILRDVDAFEMYWHAEGMKTAYEGEVIFNGERYIVSKDNSYGYADKNWGSNFTSPWVWISSNHIRSRLTGEWLRNTVFDIGGGRPKIGPVSLEGKLLGALWYEGEPYEFNFSKFWTLTRTEFRCEEQDDRICWHVVQTTPIAKMETELSCPKDEMLLVNYEAPDGSKKHNRLWNGGTGTGRVKLYRKEIGLDEDPLNDHHLLSREWKLVDDMDVFNAGCEYGEYESTETVKEECPKTLPDITDDSIEMPQRLERTVIYESPYVCLYTDRVQLPGGSIIEKYHQLHYPREAVSVVIFNEKDEILFVRNRRYTVGHPEWEITAGRIEPGETPEQAARRECLEETGCELKNLTYLCCQNPANGMSDALVHVFAARVAKEGKLTDTEEIADKRWLSKEDTLTLLRENRTRDGVSILALLYTLQFYINR